MLMMAGSQQDWQQMSTWSADDIKANIRFMQRFHDKLVESGELVDAQGLTGPEQAKIVRDQPDGPPIVTDGPFPETKEFLAGYWIVDVESEARALEIAGQASAAPGRAGASAQIPIEVRQIGETPSLDT
ncbi:MAG TPA: YciI family protein [Jiangellaceae bacterium]|nr:YciI family protein [Jiangellaceae bacterium]